MAKKTPPAPAKKSRSARTKTAAEKQASKLAYLERMAAMSPRDKLRHRIGVIGHSVALLEHDVEPMGTLDAGAILPEGLKAVLDTLRSLDRALGELPADFVMPPRQRKDAMSVGSYVEFKPKAREKWVKTFGPDPLPVREVLEDGDFLSLPTLKGVLLAVGRGYLQPAQSAPPAAPAEAVAEL